MNCENVLDNVFAQEEMPLVTRIQLNLHLLFCPDCAQEVERYTVCRDILLNDFLPPSPGLENAIMAIINAEESEALAPREAAFRGGFSTKGWVIAGLAMLVSLATVFLGMEFDFIASTAGMSYMVPIGITIGMALTSYGALFIGSHLKELTEHFGL